MRLLKKDFADNDGYEKAPILFCIFKKTETTKKVFSAIRKSKPKKLYVSSDCWREGVAGEKENVEYLRKYVLENIDWDCEVYTKFNDKNHGSGKAMEASIDWFFSNEEMGIILEDDTLAAPDFFRFCAEMLQRYKDEESVYFINGTNEGAVKNASGETYYFKKIYHFPEDVTQLWGWATWRRAWEKHDKKVLQIEEYKRRFMNVQESDDYDKYLKDIRLRVFTNQTDLILKGANNVWDFKFKFSVLVNDGLCLVPDCNLVTNIGFGVAEVSHTLFEYAVGALLPAGEIKFPLRHPKDVKALPLTPKEYLRASYMQVSSEKEFWDMEAEYASKILCAHNFLIESSLSQRQKIELYKEFMAETLPEIIGVCVLSQETARARKYLYLALTKSFLRGEGNICARCVKRKCLSVCPTKSITQNIAQNGEISININRKNCEYCHNCTKACGYVNPI